MLPCLSVPLSYMLAICPYEYLVLKKHSTVVCWLVVLYWLIFIPLHNLLLFLFSYHIYALVLLLLYHFNFYSFALSTERTWFTYISLLIIPCIIFYVTNKETLDLLVSPFRCYRFYLSLWCISQSINNYFHLLNEHCATSEMIALYFWYNYLILLFWAPF